LTGKSFIRIGIIGAAHGIRGEVKIRSFAEPPEAIFSYPLTDASGKRQFIIYSPRKRGEHKGGSFPPLAPPASGRGKKQTFIAGVKGIGDRNAAELLKGTELFALASELPEKNRLVGLEARLKDGRVYGKITQLYNFGAGDIIEIKLVNGKMEMLPLSDAFIGDIHIDKGYVIVFPPDYIEEEK